MMRNKSVVLWFFPWLLLLAACAAHASSPSLPVVNDLRVEAQQAAARQLPILLLFSTEYCEFCQLIRQDYLVPMRQDSAYRDRVLIREVPAGGIHYLRDFDGELIGGDSLALRYGADLIPTLVFIDSRGRRLTEPLVGFVSRHYYDQALDAHIDQALGKLQALE
jgi:thioredoxin-related protein